MKSVALTFRRERKPVPSAMPLPPKTPFRRIKVLTQLIKIRVRLPERKIQIPIPIRKLTSSGKINTSGQAPSGTEDNEFDRQYSLMFESNQSNVGDADYEIDESLKKKRGSKI